MLIMNQMRKRAHVIVVDLKRDAIANVVINQLL